MALFEKVAVLGFGTMGSGIAQVVAQSGRTVVVLESEQERIDSGLAAVDAFMAKGVARGKTTENEKQAVISRISGTVEVADLSDVDLVIEAVTERKDIKSSLLARVADVVRDDTVITTNTSAIPISELATHVTAEGRFAGLHFFNPAPLMRVIEIVRGLSTDDDVVDRLEKFVSELDKDAVIVKDRPGFLVNRLFMPYINDVVQAFDDELASAEDIDQAIKLGLGYKMGPLELLDLIGLDVHEHATRGAYEATLDPIYAPPPLLQTMVAAGMRGNKNGRGFRTEKSA